MRVLAIVFLSAAVGLLSFTGARATTTLGDDGDVATAAAQTGVIQLAGSFHNSNAKLADKTLGGQAGGMHGIGGSEPHAKYFKSRMKKIPRCCTGTSH